MRYFLYFILIFSPIFVSYSSTGTLHLVSSKDVFSIGEYVKVSFFMETKNSINAIEGKINYPKSILEYDRVEMGGSLVNFWVEEPHKENTGTVSFSGITPGGISGDNAFVFSIVFLAKDAGLADLYFSEFNGFIHDENSSIANFVYENTSIGVVDEKVDGEKELINDFESPEDFTPLIMSDPNLFNGKNVLVFSTQDKKTGIKKYLIKEGNFSRFVDAESPYVLRFQSLDKKITIKAIDHANNERIVSIEPSVSTGESSFTIKIFSIIILIVLLFVIIFSWRKKIF